jgi:predicted acyl esterase
MYSTPVLEQAVGVTGLIELRLFVSSSAPDTDFRQRQQKPVLQAPDKQPEM